MTTDKDIRKRALAEDSIPVEQMSPDQLRRKVARENKRYYREQEKRKAEEAAARKKAEDSAATPQQWWAAQRTTLDPETRAKLEKVHEEMLEWAAVMDEYVADGLRRTTQQDLEDTIVDIRALVAEHGLCDTGFVVVPKSWADVVYQAAINRAQRVPQFRADEVFVKYGYYAALPTHVFEPFRAKFMTRKVELFRPTYIPQVCPDCAKVRPETSSARQQAKTSTTDSAG